MNFTLICSGSSIDYLVFVVSIEDWSINHKGKKEVYLEDFLWEIYFFQAKSYDF